MRALFYDLGYSGAAVADQPITNTVLVRLPNNANRRDVWLRIEAATASPTERDYYAYKDRGTASINPRSTAFIASKLDQTVIVGQQTVVLDDNLANSPDMTDLTVTVEITANPGIANIVGIWGYTVSPEIVTMDNIRTILMQHVGAGLALEDFGTTEDTDGSSHIEVGNQLDLNDSASPNPYIGIYAGSPTIFDDPSQAGDIPTPYIRWPIQLVVSYKSLAGPTSPAGVWKAYRRCREIMDALISILCDERRKSLGEVHTISLASDSGPQPPEATTRCT